MGCVSSDPQVKAHTVKQNINNQNIINNQPKFQSKLPNQKNNYDQNNPLFNGTSKLQSISEQVQAQSKLTNKSSLSNLQNNSKLTYPVSQIKNQPSIIKDTNNQIIQKSANLEKQGSKIRTSNQKILNEKSNSILYQTNQLGYSVNQAHNSLQKSNQAVSGIKKDNQSSIVNQTLISDIKPELHGSISKDTIQQNKNAISQKAQLQKSIHQSASMKLKQQVKHPTESQAEGQLIKNSQNLRETFDANNIPKNALLQSANQQNLRETFDVNNIPKNALLQSANQQNLRETFDVNNIPKNALLQSANQQNLRETFDLNNIPKNALLQSANQQNLRETFDVNNIPKNALLQSANQQNLRETFDANNIPKNTLLQSANPVQNNQQLNQSYNPQNQIRNTEQTISISSLGPSKVISNITKQGKQKRQRQDQILHSNTQQVFQNSRNHLIQNSQIGYTSYPQKKVYNKQGSKNQVYHSHIHENLKTPAIINNQPNKLSQNVQDNKLSIHPQKIESSAISNDDVKINISNMNQKQLDQSEYQILNEQTFNMQFQFNPQTLIIDMGKINW